MEEGLRGRLRQSCPDFLAVGSLARELSGGSSASDDGDSGPSPRRAKKQEASAAKSGYAAWLEDHIEIVGSPRPLRPELEVETTAGEREESIKQVAFMAERYKAQIELQKREAVRRAVSAPDLSVMQGAETSKLLPPSPPSAPSSPPRPSPPASCCAPLARLWESLRAHGAGANGGTRGPGARRGGPYTFDSPENAVIIFDWDDTLLPTTYLLQTVLPSLSEDEKGGAITQSCPYYEELAAHAHIVEFVLRTARRAARVALVTNSLNPWVIASAVRYLPGLEMEALLRELSIPVFYARRHIDALSKNVTYHDEFFEIRLDHSTNARIGMDILPSDRALRIAKINEGGLVSQWNSLHPHKQVYPGDTIYDVNGRADDLARECRKAQVLNIKLRREVPDRDPYMEAKRIDMDTCMKMFYEESDARRNVLSVGDSAAEQMAVKEVLPRSGNPAKDSLCKTVALLPRPNIHQLSNELKVLLVWLSNMVKYDKDFDLAMDRLGELEKELFASV